MMVGLKVQYKSLTMVVIISTRCTAVSSLKTCCFKVAYAVDRKIVAKYFAGMIELCEINSSNDQLL